MTNGGADKVVRVLGIYSKLINGAIVRKPEEAVHYHVNERSIQRDIDDIRNYFEQKAINHGDINEVTYDRSRKGYRLDHIYKTKLTDDEVLAISKILLDSRAFAKTEMLDIIHRFIGCCVSEDGRKLVESLIENESFHYMEAQHGKSCLERMWEIGEAIYNSQYIEIQYQELHGKTVKTHKLKPLALMFSEYYFYLAAFAEDESGQTTDYLDKPNSPLPAVYRLDRICSMEVLPEKFHIPYRDRFEAGEFKKRIRNM